MITRREFISAAGIGALSLGALGLSACSSPMALSSAEVGDTITFGSISGSPIEWIVLDYDAGALLLLKAQCAGHCRGGADLKSYLNSFKSRAFTGSAKSLLASPVFSLSVSDCKMYLPKSNNRVCSSSEGSSSRSVDWWLGPEEESASSVFRPSVKLFRRNAAIALSPGITYKEYMDEYEKTESNGETANYVTTSGTITSGYIAKQSVYARPAVWVRTR